MNFDEAGAGAFYTEIANGYEVAVEFDAAETYYEVTETEANGTAEAGKVYYTKAGNMYTKVENVVVGATDVTGKYTLAVEVADLSADTTLGKIRLDDDDLVVIDLREGKVVRTTLEDMAKETNIYAVLYANEDCASSREANVVIILGD